MILESIPISPTLGIVPYLCFFFFELFFLSLQEGDLLSDLERASKKNATCLKGTNQNP